MTPLDGPARPFPKTVTVGGVGRPKPRHAGRANRGEWARLRKECLGPCLVCVFTGAVQVLPSSLHHVVPRGQGGADTAVNLAPVCGDGANGHHGLIEAHDPETCQQFAAALRRLLPDVYRHAVAVLGPDRFARRYQIKVPA